MSMPKSRLCLLPLLVIALAAGPARGLPGAGRLAFLGSSLWTKAHDIELRGDKAYCAFLDGLMILDLSDPKDPATLATLHLGGGLAVAVSGTTVLVAAGDKGLVVIDAGNPGSPLLKSVLDTAGEARDVLVSGSMAFVADGPEGVLAVDIADPAAPRIAGAWDSPGEATGLALAGTTVYLADGGAGLQVLDVSNPARPAPVGSLDTDGTAEAVALSGHYAYLADGSGGIKVVDVSAASAPKLGAAVAASGYAHSVAADGRLLLAGSLYDGGYQVFDLAQPDAPALVSTNKYTMYNEGWRVVLAGSRAVVVDYFSGLFFVDLAEPRKPAVTGYLPAPSSIVAVCGRGGTAFAVGELSGVLAVNVADPVRSVLVGATNIFRGVQGITTNGNFVYVTDRWSIRVYDAADPAKIRAGRPLTFQEGIPRTLVVAGKTAYLTADNFGFYTLDVADPAAPKVVGSFKIPGFTYGLAVSGDRVFLANSDSGLHVLDVKRPEAPAEIGAARIPGEPAGLAVRGDLAYVASGPAGLVIVDIKDPAAVKVLATVASDDFAGAVVLDGSFALVADGLAGVKRIDVSDPRAPRLVSSYDTPGEAQSLALLGSTILVADTYSLILLK